MSAQDEETPPPTQQPTSRCPHCGCTEFFVRKNFPQPLGMIIVVLTAAAFLVLAANPATFSIGLWLLVGMTVLDYILYYLLVGKVATCYRCRIDSNDKSIIPCLRPFDLSTSEKYRQEP